MRRSILAVAALFLVIAAGATFALRSEPADALTPTPSYTPTATPTPNPSQSFVATNSTSGAAIQLTGSAQFPVSNPNPQLTAVGSVPGCAAPTVTTTPGYVYVTLPGPDLEYRYIDFHIAWATQCVDIGESVLVSFDTSFYNVGPFAPGYTFAFSSTASSPTPGPPTSTPTYTATATPTPDQVVRTYTNTTTSGANAMDVISGPYGSLSVTGSAPGCGLPVVGTPQFHSMVYVHTSGFPIYLTRVDWPSGCIDLGEQISVTFSTYGPSLVGSTPAVFFDSTVATLTPTRTPAPPTPTETPEPPTPIPTFVALVIDCDVVASGVQSNCDVPLGTTSVSVDVVVENHTSAFDLGAVEFRVDNQDLTRLVAPVGPPAGCAAPALDCNPDFDQASLAGNWDCSSVGPNPDSDPTSGQQSFIGCFIIGLSDAAVPAGGFVSVARITYDIPPGATAGTVPLTLQYSYIYAENFLEVGSCNPVSVVAGVCVGATITLGEAPLFTPSSTATGTSTSQPPPAAQLTNDTGAPANRLTGHIFSLQPNITLTGNPADCGIPSIATTIVQLYDTSGTAGMWFAYYDIGFDIVWPTTCVDPDESVTLTFGPGIGSGPQIELGTFAFSTVPAVEKQPEGNAANADLSVPKANLWICESGPCAGMGEGELRVVEHAVGVQSDTDGDGIADVGDACICTGAGPDNELGTADDLNPIAPPNTELGLGAYEFTVEYDNFVIQSVNACDLVFGAGGAGSARGPVEELGSSAINADCAAEPSPTGSCALSLVLENLIHFGCVTSGQDQGPFGDFDLASLLLIPHPDLRNDLFPGNDNGVLTVIKDNGCELVDTLGHPVFGSVNGGLTPFCRDLAVTVRILEGDLDLNCEVNLTDAQLIASKYGAFFGGLLYSKWFDLEPALHDLDIDIKDVQKVFGREGSTCQVPIPAQPPLDPPTPFGD